MSSVIPTVPAPRERPGVRPPHRLRFGVGPGLGDVGRARREVGEWLSGLGLAESADGVGLVLGELAGNALRHAPGAGAEVVLGAGGGRAVVEVRDGSPAPPVLRTDADPYAETGRGLPLVAAFAADWGWMPGRRGKTTWAVLPAPGGYVPAPLPVCGECRLLDGEQDLRCVLQAHTSGPHHAHAVHLDGIDTGAVWARWGEGPPCLVVLPDCPAVDPGAPDEACCSYDGHPGGHSYQLTDHNPGVSGTGC
ncbi:ATP-binding protein [Streptomyces sp. NPDC004031]